MFSVKLPAVNIGALYFGAWRRTQCISLLRLGRGITLPLAIKPLSELRHMQSVKLVGLLPAILGCISGIDTQFCSEHDIKKSSTSMSSLLHWVAVVMLLFLSVISSKQLLKLLPSYGKINTA